MNNAAMETAFYVLTMACIGIVLLYTLYAVPLPYQVQTEMLNQAGTRKFMRTVTEKWFLKGRSQQKVKVKTKTILWYFPPRYLPKNINGRVPLSGCPELNCVMTRNRTFLSESDAVIFSAEHINGAPPIRTPGQVWIFHNNEPPYKFAHGRAFHTPRWSSVFNWTMDFRYDADIVRPYAVLRKRAEVINKNYTTIVNRKSKLVAIMVSNCDNWSGRLKYAQDLNKYIPVDIYGECGKRMFPREKNNEWLNYLSSNYKFYLGFENLYCKDYISEKFFNNFNLDLVTVARGGGNYSRDVPVGTFINAGDFKSPRKLAKHLLHLSTNVDKYIGILRKKDGYYYETDEYRHIDYRGMPYIEHYYEKQPLCELCRRLINIEKHSKTIPNIVPWFQKGICEKRDFHLKER